ncbi:palmitoyl acyltransferase 10, putative [Leishmania donovani]|uniref:Palmitoyltransferase n=1 Tax=Leishmania donovani TaxID=5661 RepID=A0A3S7WZD9_LEIDO|nr:palmitoyl acyltransferase 10, putative [Leishmania donovani]
MPLTAPPRRNGNIKVFLNGRIFVGPDWRIMTLSVVLISVCSLVFVFFTNEIMAARVIVGVTALISVAALLLCGLSDPGVKPRQPPPPPDAPPHESLWREREYVDQNGYVHQARLEMKWCYSCNIYRPYRGVHCRYCDQCVTRRDHHCPWTGTCIGAKNYRSYFALVWVLSVMLFTALCGGIQSFVQRIVRHSKATPVIEDGPSAFTSALIDTYGLELILIVLSFIFGLLVWSLAVYHTYLISRNLTSGDAAKDLEENVFTHGSVLANVWAALTGWREEEMTCGDARTEVVIEVGGCDDVCDAPSPSTSAHAASPHATVCDGGDASHS